MAQERILRCERLSTLVVFTVLVGVLFPSPRVRAMPTAIDPEEWLQRAKLLAPDGAGGDRFSWPVSPA